MNPAGTPNEPPSQCRGLPGAEAFCAVRSYIATARKHDIAILDALRDAFTGSPWLPPAPAAT